MRAGVKVTTGSYAGGGDLTIVCSRSVKLLADAQLVSIADQPFDAIVLPGGVKGAECFRASPLLVEKVHQTHMQGSIVAAICAALELVLQQHDHVPDWQYDRLSRPKRANPSEQMARATGSV